MAFGARDKMIKINEIAKRDIYGLSIFFFFFNSNFKPCNCIYECFGERSPIALIGVKFYFQEPSHRLVLIVPLFEAGYQEITLKQRSVWLVVVKEGICALWEND